MAKSKKTSKNSIPEVEKLYPLPSSWIWVRADYVCLKINDGTHFSPPNDSTGDIPYVTAKNIRPDIVDLSNVTYVSKKIHREIYTRCNPEKYDVLYTKDGTVGYAAVNELDFEFSLLSSVSLLKPNQKIVNSYYLSNYLNSPVNYYRITGKKTGTALRRVILERIKEIPIPLAPYNEQKRIINKIDEMFSKIEATSKILSELQSKLSSYKLSTNIGYLSLLKQSILKKAFEGKLVSQDPNDEPASKLLQKIISN